jgi:phage tail sheath protein FI
MAQLTNGPGVYIDEIASGVHTITGVSTSIAAFVDFFARGPMNEAVQVFDLGAFRRVFGGLHASSEASYAIQQFFRNGGNEAWVVRTASGAVNEADVQIQDGIGGATALTVTAINAGLWGNNLRVLVDYPGPVSNNRFNITVQLFETSGGELILAQTETFLDLSMAAGPRFVGDIVNDEFSGSHLVRVTPAGANRPQPTGTLSGVLAPFPAITSLAPQLDVTIGTEGSGLATLSAQPTSLDGARTLLESAIRAARPELRAFAQASVSIVDDRLRILAGPTTASSQVAFAPGGADPLVTTLQLTPGQPLPGVISGDVVAALAAAALPFPIAAGRQLDVTIGGAPFTLTLPALNNTTDLRDQLQAQIRAANPAATAFTGARVALHTQAGVERLIVIPGVAGAAPVFAPTGAPPGFDAAIGLDGANATAVDVLLTGNLIAAPALPPSQALVTIGGFSGPANVVAAATFQNIRAALENGIRGVAGAPPSFAGALVAYYDLNGENRYLVMADPAAATAVTFAAAPADVTTVAELRLNAGNAQANVQTYALGAGAAIAGTAQGAAAPGNNGTPPDAQALIGDFGLKTGVFALEDVDLFNILCIPRTATKAPRPDPLTDVQAAAVIAAATAYCERRRAFFIVDTPSDVDEFDEMRQWINVNAGLRHRNLSIYFPRVQVPDPLDGFRLRSFGASGTMAGVYARTDSTRGVWKAPAGIEATLSNVTRLDYRLTDPECGALNPLGVNCLRAFPVNGNLSWGARTLMGADQLSSEWKYVPIRRLALFLEESLFRGTKWVVFEPNDEPLWAKIRLNLRAFMMGLFRQGAFQGGSPDEAFYVKCDAETTTQADRNLGIVNIEAGFAPLKPAEFVVIKIQQIAGDL